MFKKTIKATFLCLAFAQSADAGGIMPNFSNDPTPETAYSTLNNSDSCLLASEALNSKDIDLTEDQKLIADLALEVQTTDLGAIVTQKNSNDNVFYCFWNDDDRNTHGNKGGYIPDLNMVYLVDSGVGDTDSLLPTAVEEFSHAAQFHSNNHPLQSLDEMNLFGKYTSLMMTEAQAKIWTQKILYDYRELNNIEHPTSSSDPLNPVTEMAHQCYVQNNGINDSTCLENAFNSILTYDNAYTSYYLQLTLNGDLGIRGEYEICNSSAQSNFGYIPDGQDTITFLSADYDIENTYGIYRDQAPPRGEFKSWQHPVILKHYDGTVALDAEARPSPANAPKCLSP